MGGALLHVHGGPSAVPSGVPPLCWGFWGALRCPPRSALPSASSACCPHCPPDLGPPGTPQDPQAGSHCPGDTAWARGGCWALLPAVHGVAAGLGHLMPLQSPPRPPGGPGVPLSVGVPWGSPWLHSHPPPGKSRSWGAQLWGEPRNSGHILLPCRARPCCPHPRLPRVCPTAPHPAGFPSPRGSPSRGVPCPAGVPIPQGSPALGGRRARAGPSNADFVSLSPL